MKIRLLGLFTLGAVSALSQPIAFGVKGGVPLTDFLNVTEPQLSIQTYTSTTNPYIVGPTVELRLPAGFSVEFDALFRHYRYQATFGQITEYAKTNATTSAWEFPLLVKYRLPAGFMRLRPYIDAGVTWDRLYGLSATTLETTGDTVLTTTTSQTSNPQELSNRTSTGFTIGGGLDIRAHFLHLSPEVRYTRWTSQHFVNFYLNSNENQAEFLLGITF